MAKKYIKNISKMIKEYDDQIYNALQDKGMQAARKRYNAAVMDCVDIDSKDLIDPRDIKYNNKHNSYNKMIESMIENLSMLINRTERKYKMPQLWMSDSELDACKTPKDVVDDVTKGFGFRHLLEDLLDGFDPRFWEHHDCKHSSDISADEYCGACNYT